MDNLEKNSGHVSDFIFRAWLESCKFEGKSKDEMKKDANLKISQDKMITEFKNNTNSEFPSHLFSTWLEYRMSKGQKRADIIREVGKKVDRKYDNNRFYTWLKMSHSVTELVLWDVIFPELPDVYKYYFEQQGFPTGGVDFKMLAEAFRPPIKKRAPLVDKE